MRILKAMDALLRRKPFAEINVAELAAKAKVSPATIYQRFSNVDATASVLLELYFAKVEEWAERPRERPLEATTLFDALLEVASDAFDQVVALEHVMRPAYLYSRYRPERVGPEWSRLEQRAVEGFRDFLRQHADEIRVEASKEAARFLSYFFNFMLLGPLLHSEDPAFSSQKKRRAFVHSLATMAYRYLTAL